MHGAGCPGRARRCGYSSDTCALQTTTLPAQALGSDAWIRDATLLAGLKPFAEDAAFRKRWRDVKIQKKAALSAYIKEVTGYDVPTGPMYDVQVRLRWAAAGIVVVVVAVGVRATPASLWKRRPHPCDVMARRQQLRRPLSVAALNGTPTTNPRSIHLNPIPCRSSASTSTSASS